MNIDDIEICVGKPSFPFRAIRRLEVKCEASSALMPAPTIDEANGRLRALAAKVGANAIVEVEYDSGVSFTSWKSLKAKGLAVERESDERTCPVCAETIKRAATKCRFCGTDLEQVAEVPQAPAVASTDVAQPEAEPLRDNNNPALIIGLIVFGFFVLMLIVSAAGS